MQMWPSLASRAKGSAWEFPEESWHWWATWRGRRAAATSQLAGPPLLPQVGPGCPCDKAAQPQGESCMLCPGSQSKASLGSDFLVPAVLPPSLPTISSAPPKPPPNALALALAPCLAVPLETTIPFPPLSGPGWPRSPIFRAPQNLRGRGHCPPLSRREHCRTQRGCRRRSLTP